MKKDILDRVYKLIELHKTGALGGEFMPEDENPNLPKDSNQNYIYFTLPMALNYQRNSYKLWEAANKSYSDCEVNDIFNPAKVIEMPIETLRQKLLKHKIALQPNKHIEIWRTISNTITKDFDGDLRQLFSQNDNDVEKIKTYIQNHKKSFPYLGGAKILNYWLYVIEQYTDMNFKNRQHISVAPDTHVIQASLKLGIIEDVNIDREKLSQKWQELLKDEALSPIDVHTPMWLWSRNGFKINL